MENKKLKRLNGVRKEKRTKVERGTRIGLFGSFGMALLASPVFAAGGGTNYVKNLSDWVLGMVLWACLLGCIGMAVFAAVKKEYSKMAIFIVIGAFLAYICANPQALITLGDVIGGAAGL